MLRQLARAAALLPALWLSAAGAFGLGEIEVRSRLNQAFSASIPLTGLSADQAESVLVSLASNADFERAGLERADYLSALKLEVQSRAGQPQILITSQEIAREPFVSFLVDVRGANSRLLREYTVLLDPPDTAASDAPPTAKPVAAARKSEPASAAVSPVAAEPMPAAVPAPAPAPVVTPTASLASPPKPAAAPVTSGATGDVGGRYGPVKPQETLWSIALKLRPDATVSMDQMQIGLYDANPKAFDRGLMLLRDVTLQVPDAATLRAIDATQARQRVAELNANPGVSSAAADAPPTAQTAPPAAATPAAEPETSASPQTAVQAPEISASPAELAEPVTEEVPAAEDPVADTNSDTSSESTPATAAESVVPEPNSQSDIQSVEPPAAEEAGLMGTLLPLLFLLLLAALGFGAWKFIQRNRGAQKFGDLRPANQRAAAPAAATAAALSAEALEARKRADQAEAEVMAAYSQTPAQESTPVHSRTQSQPAVESTLTQTSQLPDFNATHIFDSPDTETSSLPADHVDFDVTSQFEAGTVQIDLNAGDPLAEADFHLAYGLYDEAALLLRKALEKDPNNVAAVGKLAETYFAAGKATEFQEIGEEAKRLLPAAEWQKLAIMGRQLCPGVPLFEGSDTDAPLTGDVDLSFDEPTTVSAAPSASTDMLDFRMEIPDPAAVEEAPPAAEAGNALEFNLDDFKLPDVEAEPAPPAAEEKLDLGSFDLEAPTPVAAAQPAAAETPEAEISLEDFDLGGDSTSISSGDEVATKLDLARAYVDMGDNEMARSLLAEVQAQGNQEQQREAQTLISRLA